MVLKNHLVYLYIGQLSIYNIYRQRRPAEAPSHKLVGYQSVHLVAEQFGSQASSDAVPAIVFMKAKATLDQDRLKQDRGCGF